LFGKEALWDDSFFMPAEIQDVIIDKKMISEKKYFLCKCNY